LIKIFLTPLNFINYSISQQIASKITIFSQAFISVLLPNLARQKRNIKKDELINFYFYLFYFIGLVILFLTNHILEQILQWWLKSNLTLEFLELFYIFVALTFTACNSHILICFYEVNNLAKKNTIFETILIIPFIILLFLCILNKEIIYAAYLILFTELTLFFIRLNYIKKNIFSPFLLAVGLTSFNTFWLSNNFKNYDIKLFIIIIFIIINSKLIYNVYKKYKR